MLGETIRRRREEQKLSQESLAELVGVSRQAISKWETGQAVPTGDNLERLARALDLDPDGLAALLRPVPAGGLPRRRWLPAAALAGVALAFLVGWLASPGSSRPMVEPPLPTPSVPVPEASPLWPDAIPTVRRRQLDFGFDPPGEPMTIQFERIGVLDEAELLWEGPIGEEGALLAVAGTPVESTGEYSLWVLGKGPADGDYLVLARIADLGPEVLRTFTTEPFSNILGYDGIAVYRPRRGGWQPGDPVFTFLIEEGEPGADDVTGWRSDGAPLPTARELARLAARELEALTGWRPERCYVRAGGSGVSLSLTPEPGGRDFFSMQFDGAVTGRERTIQVIQLTWQGEWTPWSPLTADALPLPPEWDGWSDRERCLWWCARRTDAGTAPVQSAEQSPDGARCALADGRFYELNLDRGTGLLKALRGPYPEGFQH